MQFKFPKPITIDHSNIELIAQTFREQFNKKTPQPIEFTHQLGTILHSAVLIGMRKTENGECQLLVRDHDGSQGTWEPAKSVLNSIQRVTYFSK